MSKLWLLLGLLLACVSVSAFDKFDYLSPPLEVNAGLFEGYAVHYLKVPALSLSTASYDVGSSVRMFQNDLSNTIKSYRMQEEVLWNETISYEVVTNCTYKQVVTGNVSWVVDKCLNKTESYVIPHSNWRDVKDVSVKPGEQKKVRFVYKWDKSAFVRPVKIDYVPEITADGKTYLYSEYAWFNASCGKKQNFSMSNIYGTQTINLTLLGNSTINPTTSNSNLNFTFADASDTAQLNWFMDFVLNGSQQASQMLQFFVNISNNDSIWMYYDCNFPTTAETKITGNNSKVMTAYYNFDDGLQGWVVAGAGGSCVVVNDTTSNVSHGNQSGNQRLQMNTNAGSGNNCRTGGVGNNSNNALLNNFVNMEWLGRIKTDSAGSANDGGGLWACGFASCASTNDISTFNYETMLDWSAKTWRRLHTPTTVIHTFAVSPVSFYRFKSIMNETISSANVYSWVNGTPVTTRTDIMYTGYRGIQAIGMYGETGAVSEIDDIKVWVQNNATIPVWSGVEENATPPVGVSGANWSYNFVDASSPTMFESAVSSFWINLSWNMSNIDNVSCLLDYENGSKSSMVVLGSGINGSGYNNSQFNVSVFVPVTIGNNSGHSVKFNCSFVYYDGRQDNLTANYTQGVWWAFRIVGGNATAGYYETGSWDSAYNVTKIADTYYLDNSSIRLVYNNTLYDDGFVFVNDDVFHQVIVLPLIITNNTPNRFWWNWSMVYDNGYVRNYSLDYTQNLWWAYIPKFVVVPNRIETDNVLLSANITKVMNKAGLGGVFDFWNNNRTAYLVTNSSSLGVLEANVSLPLINVSSFVVNTTAYWDISWDGVHVNRSVWNNSNVTQMVLTSCNSSLTSLRGFNFTLKDELSSAWLNGSVSMAWTLFKNLVGLNRTYSFEWAKNDSWGLCIYPSSDDLNFFGNAMYSASGYPLRTGSWTGVLSPPTSQAYDLLLMGSSNGTKVTLIVLDELNQGVMNSVVRVSKFDVGLSQYVWIGSPIMGLSGSNSIYLELNTQHRFEVLYGGVAYSNLSFVVTDTSYTFKIILNSIPDLLDWEKANRLSRTLTCNNASRSMSYVWNDTLGEISSVCLEVMNTSESEWSSFYNVCSANESGVLGLAGLDGNNSWVGLGKAWVNGSVWTIDSCSLSAYQQEIILGKEGLFWAIMVLLVIEVVGVAFSPVVALVLLIPYFVFVTMAGLWGIGYTIILGVLCVTILLVFALKR